MSPAPERSRARNQESRTPASRVPERSRARHIDNVPRSGESIADDAPTSPCPPPPKAEGGTQVAPARFSLSAPERRKAESQASGASARRLRDNRARGEVGVSSPARHGAILNGRRAPAPHHGPGSRPLTPPADSRSLSRCVVRIRAREHDCCMAAILARTCPGAVHRTMVRARPGRGAPPQSPGPRGRPAPPARSTRVRPRRPPPSRSAGTPCRARRGWRGRGPRAEPAR